MKISEMLLDKQTKPAKIAAHPQLTRAAFVLKAHGYPTPLDAILREKREICAEALNKMGM